MKLVKSKSLLQMTNSEIELTGFTLVDQIESCANEMLAKNKNLTYADFCIYKEPLIALARKFLSLIGEVDYFNLTMTETIEPMFKRGDKRNETINIIGRAKRV